MKSLALITLHPIKGKWKIIYSAFTLNQCVLSEHNEIPTTPSTFVNPTLFIVLISELLIKTRGSLSQVSCGLIDCSCFVKTLFRLLSGQTLSHMWKRNRDRRGRGLGCITMITVAQTLIYRQPWLRTVLTPRVLGHYMQCSRYLVSSSFSYSF